MYLVVGGFRWRKNYIYNTLIVGGFCSGRVPARRELRIGTLNNGRGLIVGGNHGFALKGRSVCRPYQLFNAWNRNFTGRDRQPAEEKLRLQHIDSGCTL